MVGQHVRDACAEAGVDNSLPYHRRKTDEPYKTAWVDAASICQHAIEEKAGGQAGRGRRSGTGFGAGTAGGFGTETAAGCGV